MDEKISPLVRAHCFQGFMVSLRRKGPCGILNRDEIQGRLVWTEVHKTGVFKERMITYAPGKEQNGSAEFKQE